MNKVLPQRFSIASLFVALTIALLCASIHVSRAQTADTQSDQEQVQDQATLNLGPSGLPLPRFVSLKPARVNVRVGPGRNYAVSWLFMKSGLPVEIIQEYDNWRRIRDADGTEGWVYQSLLSGKRTAMTAPWEKSGRLLELHATPDARSAVIAQIEPGVITSIRECRGEWCQLEIRKIRGWIAQRDIWGAYPGEKFD